MGSKIQMLTFETTGAHGARNAYNEARCSDRGWDGDVIASFSRSPGQVPAACSFPATGLLVFASRRSFYP